MGKVIIMTDGVAGIPKELVKKYDIVVVPTAYISINGQTYLDGIEITPSEAYQALIKDPDTFMTSAIAPEYLLKILRQVGRKSTEILFITISSALSAVSKTAGIAVSLFQEESPQTNIRVYDSKTVASSQGLVVLAAAKAAKAGQNMEQVTEAAIKMRQTVKEVMLLETLRYVYRTGRMPKLASQLASFLSIKPVLRVSDEGKLVDIGLVRNRDAGIEKMLKIIKKDIGERAHYFMVMHADDPEFAAEFSRLLKKEFNCLDVIISEFSPIMGYGSGPGALYVAYHPEMG